jgi:hypothetical protein
MKETRKKSEEKALPKDIPVFDPENPPYQVQHLCVYMREMEDEAEEREGQ